MASPREVGMEQPPRRGLSPGRCGSCRAPEEGGNRDWESSESWSGLGQLHGGGEAKCFWGASGKVPRYLEWWVLLLPTYFLDSDISIVSYLRFLCRSPLPNTLPNFGPSLHHVAFGLEFSDSSLSISRNLIILLASLHFPIFSLCMWA